MGAKTETEAASKVRRFTGARLTRACKQLLRRRDVPNLISSFSLSPCCHARNVRCWVLSRGCFCSWQVPQAAEAVDLSFTLLLVATGDSASTLKQTLQSVQAARPACTEMSKLCECLPGWVFIDGPQQHVFISVGFRVSFGDQRLDRTCQGLLLEQLAGFPWVLWVGGPLGEQPVMLGCWQTRPLTVRASLAQLD